MRYLKKYAIDYDDTFTAARVETSIFIRALVEAGHEVKFVTARGESNWNNLDITGDATRLGIDIVFCEGRPKQDCYAADIWMDDNPHWILNEETLKRLRNGESFMLNHSEPMDYTQLSGYISND